MTQEEKAQKTSLANKKKKQTHSCYSRRSSTSLCLRVWFSFVDSQYLDRLGKRSRLPGHKVSMGEEVEVGGLRSKVGEGIRIPRAVKERRMILVSKTSVWEGMVSKWLGAFRSFKNTRNTQGIDALGRRTIPWASAKLDSVVRETAHSSIL